MEKKGPKGTKPKVLNVGHCGFDHGNIGRVLEEEFGVEVDGASTADAALRAVRDGEFDLVLVNRVFDANGESGLDLIKRLQAHEETRATPVMLVSNYPEAQEAAVAAGARPGFGKSALSAPETRERLAAVLVGGTSRR
jgi:CheY-like chemotaxis protein